MEPHKSYDDLRARSFSVAHATGDKRPVVFLHTAEAEVGRLLKLVQEALDALDAEKTPDYGLGHDRAFAALTEALTGNPPPDRLGGARETPLDQLEPSADLRIPPLEG